MEYIRNIRNAIPQINIDMINVLIHTRNERNATGNYSFNNCKNQQETIEKWCQVVINPDLFTFSKILRYFQVLNR